MPSRRHAAASFIFVTVMLDMLAFGIAAPPLPKLISDFLGGNTARASEYLGLFITTFAVMQFFFSPVIGLLSDRFGRRPVVLLSNFGLSLDYLVLALAPSLNWLFVGRVLAGVTSSSMPTAMAYISDVTAPEKRAKAFGMIGAAFGVGFVVGPAIGGLLSQHNPRLPFWVGAGASLLLLLVSLPGLEALLQEREALGESGVLVGQAGDRHRELHEHRQHEQERDREDRRRGVGDAGRTREFHQRALREGEHEHRHPRDEPQDRVALHQALAPDQLEDQAADDHRQDDHLGALLR